MLFVSLSFPSGALLSAIIRNIVGACCWVACCLINRKRFLISAWVGLFRFIKSFNATLSAGGVSDAVAWLRTFQYRIIYANCNKCELFMKLYFLPLLSGATRYSHALLADNLCPFIRSCIFGFCHPRLVMKIQFFAISHFATESAFYSRAKGSRNSTPDQQATLNKVRLWRNRSSQPIKIQRWLIYSALGGGLQINPCSTPLAEASSKICTN